MTLELFTAIGALVGGLVAFLLDERLLAAPVRRSPGYVAVTMARARPMAPRGARPARSGAETGPVRPTIVGQLSGDGYRRPEPAAGRRSGPSAPASSRRCSGIGGGIVKVPLMHLAMGVPLRVATATSNLMIGITAAGERGHLPAARRASTRTSPARRRSASSWARRSGRGSRHRIDLRYLRLLFVVVLALHRRPDARSRRSDDGDRGRRPLRPSRPIGRLLDRR